ncbi:acetyltransferase [Curvibacter sp. RS43]|uniref:acetyltransferase n=1 Tax=Curvibacter microcysteis TaxID=3026419 RepID=UPI0023630FB7|nr:acetyltransferase [Curvibacter sp. RS43]MDD0811810.1 acetyltransferase [Curvibacter sp. RS43]
MKRVVIYGAGALAREVVGHHQAMAANRDVDFEFVGYFSDSGPDASFENETGLPFIEAAGQSTLSQCAFLVCIADPAGRQAVTERILQAGGSLTSYVHPTAIVLKSARVAEGCIFFPHVVVSANARVGRGVVINSYSGVGHDVVIGNFTTISAQVDLMGHVQIGHSCFFGSGARVVPGKKIGNACQVGVGVAVIKSLQDGVTVLPQPNKVMRFE